MLFPQKYDCRLLSVQARAKIPHVQVFLMPFLRVLKAQHLRPKLPCPPWFIPIVAVNQEDEETLPGRQRSRRRSASVTM